MMFAEWHWKSVAFYVLLENQFESSHACFEEVICIISLYYSIVWYSAFDNMR
ncbi:hypothetical protein BT63DRAFT_66063 [Microthyrium microscopicum]|uniref:Uncharacterized protein n=1 Tax=Microthyrium microscopicum TaxID=703497 RepID=A0A6A6U3A0_9PEZI|nr:hypothetical protein BT63DRAFT_66063 [Microthyrium microscopicum]